MNYSILIPTLQDYVLYTHGLHCVSLYCIWFSGNLCFSLIILQIQYESLQGELDQTKKEVKDLKKQFSENKTRWREINEKIQDSDTCFREFYFKYQKVIRMWSCVWDFHRYYSYMFYLMCYLTQPAKWRTGDGSSREMTNRGTLHTRDNLDKKRKLQLFEEIILTLLSLRLRLIVDFTSMLFDISQSSVSAIFTTWISFLE